MMTAVRTNPGVSRREGLRPHRNTTKVHMAQAESRDADHSFRLGRISVSIWKNHTDEGRLWFSVQITRRYLDGDTWQYASRFGREDLPLVGLASFMAYSWCWRQKLPAASDQHSATNGVEQSGTNRTAVQGGNGHDDGVNL